MNDIGKPKILIVDDVIDNIKILIDLFKSDYKTFFADNGEKAIKLAKRKTPDLILLDIIMPDMNGYEVCKYLKEDKETQKIPIIFVTAMSEAMDEAKGFKLGAIDYVNKPFIPVVVKARVATHIALKHYQDHLEDLVAQRTKELEVAKKTAEESKILAEKANKAKSRFLMNMSHELRTPLNAVLISTSIITGEESKEEIIECKEMIESSSYGLLQTIEQILDFTRSKDGELKLDQEPFSLTNALKEIKTQFIHKGSKVRLIPKIESKTNNIPDKLIGNKKYLLSILNTLLENSSKFCDKKPQANLILEKIGQTSEDISIQFSLQDNGIGISEDYYKDIFEPFFQIDSSTTRKFDGTGMGLALCKQLIEEVMFGKIWVESNQTQSSIFYFTAFFKVQEGCQEVFDVSYVNNNLQEKETISKTTETVNQLPKPNILTVKPLIEKLSQSLQEADPGRIKNCLAEIKKYQIPKISELTEAVENYEYEEALLLLNDIVIKAI